MDSSFAEPPLRVDRADELSWDGDADVIVVGFGGAGACAAIEAAEQGAEVIVFDRYGGGGATERSGGSSDELKRLIAESYAGGHIDPGEAGMLTGVFHLHEQEARQVMTPIPAVVTLDVSQNVGAAVELCVSSGHTRLVVTENEDRDRVRGLVHDAQGRLVHAERRMRRVQTIQRIHENRGQVTRVALDAGPRQQRGQARPFHVVADHVAAALAPHVQDAHDVGVV